MKLVGLLRAAVGVLVAFWLHAWALLALHYGPFDSPWQGLAITAAYAAAVLVIFRRLRRYAWLFSLIPFLAVVIWWSSIEATTGKVYPPENSRQAWAEFAGEEVLVHDVRHFKYRSNEEFEAHWEDRRYRLDRAQSLDVFLSYWDGHTDIAHTFLSFGFSDGRYLCVSIEVRSEANESYDTLKGFFKQFELIYVWGDERDLVQVRTSHRDEDVYCYRTTLPRDKVRALLVDMLEESGRLRENPEFYNTPGRDLEASACGGRRDRLLGAHPPVKPAVQEST